MVYLRYISSALRYHEAIGAAIGEQKCDLLCA